VKTDVKVLVTGAGSLLGQGIIRALQSSSLRPRIVAVDPSPLAAGLYWVEAPYLVPPVSDDGYLRRIEEILSRENPDAVLIGTDVELAVFAEHRERLEREGRTRVVVSSPEVVAIADDKWKTYLFIRANRLDAPDSCLPGDERELVERVGFPLVVKPRVGARSKGVRLAHDWAELRAALGSGPDLIVQQCVGTDDTEYTAGALCFEGEYAGSIVMRRELRDGNTYRAFVEEYPELNRAVRVWTEILKPRGPVNFQFRLDGGRPKVFEINARFSGTTPFRAHAGFNEVEMALRHVLEGEIGPPPPIKRMTILRHWSETVVAPPAPLGADGTRPAGDRAVAAAAAGGQADVVLLLARGVDAERWRDSLRQFPRRDIYYTPEYALASESPGETAAAALMVCGGDAVIHPVMIRDLSVLPWAAAMKDRAGRCDVITPYGYGGPLCSAQDPARRDALLRAFERQFRAVCRRRGAVSEFIRFHPLLATHRGVDGELDLVRRGETVWLDISTDEERVMAAMSPAARNKVRRARRDGVVVRAQAGPDAIQIFTGLYRETLDRLAAPSSYYFPERYFERLSDLVGPACEILIAWRDGFPLWAGMFLRDGELLHYHLSGSAGGRIPGVNNLGLLVAALRGASRGARIFHLGGGVGSRPDSLFAFKASVGDRRAEYWTGQRIFDPVSYRRLCEARGKSMATNGSYFPAYRAPELAGISCAS
jgi:carbamoyl-phosphate synthase large subunit